MPSHIDGTPADVPVPSEMSWRIGSPVVGAMFGLLACGSIVLALGDLAGGDRPEGIGSLLPWVRLAAAVVFLAIVVRELRRRVVVDRDGVHVVETVRRRTYPWREVSEVRAGRPVLFGDAYVYLTVRGGRRVELPRSGDRLELLGHWHAVMSSQ